MRPIYMKRDPHTWKETHIHEKRPIYMKRDPYTWKETHIHETLPWDRALAIAKVNGWDLLMWKETYLCEKRPTYVKRDLLMWKETYICEKRPTYVKRDLLMWKETYLCEKRPTYVKRDLPMWEEICNRDSVVMERRCFETKFRMKRRHLCMKWNLRMWKVTYLCETSPLDRALAIAKVTGWVMSHIWLNHATYEGVVSRVVMCTAVAMGSRVGCCRGKWMGHVTHMNESCHIWRSRVTYSHVCCSCNGITRWLLPR